MLPAPPDHGIVFERTDVSPPVQIPALATNVARRARRTTLSVGWTLLWAFVGGFGIALVLGLSREAGRMVDRWRQRRAGRKSEEIEEEYDNTWIRTDYICKVCSKYTRGYDGTPYIKATDQKQHPVFVQIENGRIRDILGEETFEKQGMKSFVDYC